jgi:putative holliday junction resolvase
MVVLAVDPGEKNIGIAVSDPTGALARPLTVVRHAARQIDAAVIAQLAAEQRANLIIVGQALDDDGEPTPEGRKAARLAEAIRGQTEIPVQMWDESGSTSAARAIHIQSGGSRRRRRGHMDDAAAAIILQTYLDAHNPPDLVPPDCLP